jgi:hypothetical protein
MPRVGFEPTISEFEQAKKIHALDRAATVIGSFITYSLCLKKTAYKIIMLFLYPSRQLSNASTNLYEIWYVCNGT